MNVEDFVATLTDQINPSLPGWTARTRPKGHWLWWTLSSGIKIRSPIAKLWRSLIHFCRYCKFGRYSDNYLLQNTSGRYWTCFQRRWQYKSFRTKSPGGKFKCDRSNKWLAVKDSESIGLHATVESQWSTIENSLNFCHQRWQCLSRTNCCIKWTLKIFLTERIVRSQTPPMCDAPAKLNFHLMFF